MSISSVVNLVAGKIGELCIEEAKFLYGVKDQFEDLQNQFELMQSFLIDMEDMVEEGSGNEQTRTIIKQVRKIAYDAEDVIEIYILEVSNSSSDKKDNFFKRYLCFCSALTLNHKIGSKIMSIKARIDETMGRWKNYRGESGFKDSYPRQGGSNKKNTVLIAYSHIIEDHVVGLDADINNLFRVLTNDEDPRFKVVSIVGMGGSGKTTLARKLFNQETLIRHFNCTIWISLLKQWDSKQILVELLRMASGGEMHAGEDWSPESIVEKLHQHLEKKRYLIVLDDVWEGKVLQHILPALPLESDGRKIIVTTRNKRIVEFPNMKCFVHEPRCLTEEESWELFTKMSRIDKGSEEIEVLETLGKDMLKKCQGLPLAVIALAGILSNKKGVDEWEKMKKVVSSRIMENGTGTLSYGAVNEMLALSYYDFSRELKPCFLYLAQFPEDYEIQTGQLIRMWIAEGFVEIDNLSDGDTLEDRAIAYLEELVQRCVVKITRLNYQGKVKSIRVHDLVRDLCIKKAKEEDFLERFSSKSLKSDTIATKSRRAAIYSCDRMYCPFPTKTEHLRSLVYVVGDREQVQESPSLQSIHESYRLLRVLILDGIKTRDGILPEGIGSCIHLRYLGLRNTNVMQLPPSIGNLRSLITLDCMISPGIRNGGNGFSIPNVLWKMKGLRHIYLFMYEGEIMSEIFQLDTLKNLQTLKGIKGGDWMLKELPSLSQSVRKLTITGVTSEQQLEAAFQCPSIRMDRLHSLELDWEFETEEYVKPEILKPTIHCQHLRKLNLCGRLRDGLQHGIHFLPTSIKKLVLMESRFKAESTLVAISKLPLLTNLILGGSCYMGKSWTCSTGVFPRLENLDIGAFWNWEEWIIETGALPRLKVLAMSHCKKLIKIPEGLKFITTLHELQFQFMSDGFYKRIEGGGEDAHIIQHVPLIKF